MLTTSLSTEQLARNDIKSYNIYYYQCFHRNSGSLLTQQETSYSQPLSQKSAAKAIAISPQRAARNALRVHYHQHRCTQAVHQLAAHQHNRIYDLSAFQKTHLEVRKHILEPSILIGLSGHLNHVSRR